MSFLFDSVLSGWIADPPTKSLVAARNEHMALSKSALPSTLETWRGITSQLFGGSPYGWQSFFLTRQVLQRVRTGWQVTHGLPHQQNNIFT